MEAFTVQNVASFTVALSVGSTTVAAAQESGGLAAGSLRAYELFTATDPSRCEGAFLSVDPPMQIWSVATPLESAALPGNVELGHLLCCVDESGGTLFVTAQTPLPNL